MANLTHSFFNPVVSGISTKRLKHLLISLSKDPHESHFRYRLMGEMWQSSFMDVIQVTANGVLLNDENAGTHILLTDLKTIMQFEIDSCVSEFRPYCHYGTVPASLYGS